jgi:hypothetical protein
MARSTHWLMLCLLLLHESALGFYMAGLETCPAQRRGPVQMAAKKKGKGSANKGKPREGGGGGGAGGFGATKGGFGSKLPKAVTIPTLQLNTGAEMPALCFGTYRTGGDELRAALDSAIAVGYRHFDTARIYQNEAVVGAAIAASGLPREAFFITSKLWPSDHGHERAAAAVDASLHELGTDYIDLYLMHGPGKDARPAGEIIELRQQAWLAMEAAHAAGMVGEGARRATPLPVLPCTHIPLAYVRCPHGPPLNAHRRCVQSVSQISSRGTSRASRSVAR